RDRADFCWDVALGLSFVDSLRGMFYHTLSLQMSLELGDVNRVARAVAAESVYPASLGRHTRRLDRLFALGEHLAKNVRVPVAEAAGFLVRGVAGTLLGTWKTALSNLDRCSQILTERPLPIVDQGLIPTFMLDHSHIMALGPLHYLGRMRESRLRNAPLLKDALARNDVVTA